MNQLTQEQRERLTKPFKEHLREQLKTTDDYIGYLDACHKEGPETFALAVQDVLDFTATAMRDACVNKVKAETPDSWLDPLLTGPGAVISKPPYDCKDAEKLLQAVSKRTVTALQSLTIEVAATTQKGENDAERR